MRFVFPIEVEDMTAEDGGGLLVRFPDWWGGTVTDGADLSEALANARDCLGEMIAHIINKREDFPVPSPACGRRLVSPEVGLAFKAGIWLAMREQGVSFDELARRLGLASTGKSAQLIDPRRRTRLAQLDAAATALGKRVVVTLIDAA